MDDDDDAADDDNDDTDDGRKVMTKAHMTFGSGELKIVETKKHMQKMKLYMWVRGYGV